MDMGFGEWVTRPTLMIGDNNRNARDWANEPMITDGNRAIEREYITIREKVVLHQHSARICAITGTVFCRCRAVKIWPSALSSAQPAQRIAIFSNNIVCQSTAAHFAAQVQTHCLYLNNIFCVTVNARSVVRSGQLPAGSGNHGHSLGGRRDLVQRLQKSSAEVKMKLYKPFPSSAKHKKYSVYTASGAARLLL
jgi:hypothetical protein